MTTTCPACGGSGYVTGHHPRCWGECQSEGEEACPIPVSCVRCMATGRICMAGPMPKPGEWLVEGPHGAQWLPGRDGDEACEAYVARYRLTPWQHDALCVVNARERAS